MPVRGRHAGASGSAVLSGVRRRLEAGWPPGLTVLTGEDLFHLDRAQQALLERLVPEDCSDFALSVFAETKVAIADVVAAARSMPMFAEQRVVLVRDVLMLEGEEAALTAYAAKPPPRSFLLLRAPKLDHRRALHKALAQAPTLLEFQPAADEREREREIEALARERGLTLEREVTALLCEVAAQDLYRAASELDKIAAWIGPKAGPVVTLESAREVISGGSVLTGWEVANAWTERDPEAAVAAVRKLVDAGEEPIRILGGLAFRVRALLQAKALAETGASLREILGAVRTGGNPASLERALKRYTLDELRGFPLRLLQADLSLKSRGLDPRALLESLVVSLTRRVPSAHPERQ